jgi:hypothetical protein
MAISVSYKSNVVIGSYLPERPESDQNGIEITDFST